MHQSVMDFLRQEISKEEIFGKELLEVGSQNVNGSPREALAVHGPVKWTGVDFAAGRGVDLVMNAKDIVAYFGLDRFDVVISTEMLEHAKDWREAVAQMKGVLRPGGLLILTTRSPGFPFHGYPHDYWRFTPDHMKAIFADMEVLFLVSDPGVGCPGVLLKARKTSVTGTVDLSQIQVSGVA